MGRPGDGYRRRPVSAVTGRAAQRGQAAGQGHAAPNPEDVAGGDDHLVLGCRPAAGAGVADTGGDDGVTIAGEPAIPSADEEIGSGRRTDALDQAGNAE